MSKWVRPATFAAIQTRTNMVWLIRKTGVPKNRSESLGFEGEPVVAEDRGEMHVSQREAVVLLLGVACYRIVNVGGHSGSSC